ncbi:MAG TPA: glycosyltransferase family 2 protein [Ginsengibacter sp.]|nr:glycosyltransferase family 2 protein [Ginsengibacter sp.]HRP17075.1 glycosyltransferase family 2 protein [Ginsengibacter sp.]HRP43342.1 glycosyltransferase family 2 protein [Ginsengibacter sp.]
MLSIIIPVYNEQENIAPLLEALKSYTPADSEYLLVDDGSTDDTLKAISLFSGRDSSVKCISLSRNFGQQNALMAGLHYAKGDVIIIMDSDLQHPPALIPEMLRKINEGYDIVQTRRTGTQRIGVIKRISTYLFYKFINSVSDIRIETNAADFKAFTRKVLDNILQFEERDLFLRGVFSWVGFSTTTINFEAPPRKYGTTKYSFGKMMILGLRGVTSFSLKPLRIAFLAGMIISLLAFCMGIYYFFVYFRGDTVPGWMSLMTAVLFLGGVQLLAIGLLGEYVAGLVTESKKRPLYLIKDTINIK